MRRTIFNIALLLSIIFLPWWCALIIGAASIFFVSRMFELLAWGALFDALFGAPVSGFPLKGLVAGAILCTLSFFITKRLLMRI